MSDSGNQSCLMGAEDTVSFLVCVFHAWEEWAGLGQLEDYLSVLEYLLWVFTPLIVVFILPFLIVILLYLSILFLHVYKRKNQLREAYCNNLWDGARKTLATLWDGHGAIWHGYEIHGMEKIPDKGPALIVYYHGAIPIDYYYFLANVIIQKGRPCHSVADHFLFKVPGFKLLLEVFSVIHGPQEECVRALRSGHLLGISPGGVREALFSDETYPLLWGKRKGFAQVAIDSQVPVIPMFTQNLREGFRSLGTLRFFRWVYERFRLPIAPVYGGFPVKFRTFLGDPIPYEPNVNAAELAEKMMWFCWLLQNATFRGFAAKCEAVVMRVNTSKAEVTFSAGKRWIAPSGFGVSRCPKRASIPGSCSRVRVKMEREMDRRFGAVRGRPRTCWRDYRSCLTWERFGVSRCTSDPAPDNRKMMD
ncbi:DGAT1/2-independent enzyme synthesizing storage lipids isoform X1 [Anarrhichthys ocellatus]|uniref:DGAT1/2-independent enzyme synthesizing storage lipids isoform X1 n=1 Tax=Anarrhichthys ocellatus TaxID=433405 RepID=UPI0012ECDDDE|nr:transmembrane protein 68 isoform X1 [Anarrhichthys ocellatus]